MSNRFGYCCINLTLQQSEGAYTNRTARKKSFEEKGMKFVSELALQNTRDLARILEWNAANNIKVFRMSSDMFPWASEYLWEDLPDLNQILDNLSRAGTIAKESGQRLGFHPGQFNCLCSPKENVVLNSIRDLQIHGDIMDMLGQPRDCSASINIHLGGAYNDHAASAERWCKNFERLPENVKSRLTIENDDKQNMFSTKMLYDFVYKKVGIPIVFDSHHFECGPQDTSYFEAFEIASSTWSDGVRQLCHHSNSRKIYEDPNCAACSHSDYYYKKFDSCGREVDIDLECKAKELGLIDYIQKFESSIA